MLLLLATYKSNKRFKNNFEKSLVLLKLFFEHDTDIEFYCFLIISQGGFALAIEIISK